MRALAAIRRVVLSLCAAAVLAVAILLCARQFDRAAHHDVQERATRERQARDYAVRMLRLEEPVRVDCSMRDSRGGYRRCDVAAGTGGAWVIALLCNEDGCSLRGRGGD